MLNSRIVLCLLAALNAAIIGLSFSLTKTAVAIAGPFDTLACRFTWAFCVYTFVLWLLKKPVRFEFRRFVRLLPLALFYPIGFFAFQAFGLIYTTSVEAGIITAIAPILTALIAAVFIGERTNRYQMLAICLTVFGVIYISVHKGNISGSGNVEYFHFLGFFLIFLSCLSSAGYTVVNRVAIRAFTVREISYYLMLVGVLFFVPLSVATHYHSGTIATMFQPLANPLFVLPVAYLGLFASLGTSLLTSVTLKKLTSSQQAVFLNFSTLIAIVVGYVFLGEDIHSYHIIGATMILLGVFGTNLLHSRNEEKSTVK